MRQRKVCRRENGEDTYRQQSRNSQTQALKMKSKEIKKKESKNQKVSKRQMKQNKIYYEIMYNKMVCA